MLVSSSPLSASTLRKTLLTALMAVVVASMVECARAGDASLEAISPAVVSFCKQAIEEVNRLESSGQITEALALLDRSYCRLDEEAKGANSLKAFLLAESARLYELRGNANCAADCYAASVAMLVELLPPEQVRYGHEELVVLLTNLASCLAGADRYDEAEPLAQRSLTMAQTIYPPSLFPKGHPNLAGASNNLGHILLRQERYAEAHTCFLESLRIDQQLYPADRFPRGHRFVAVAQSNLGLTLQGTGDYRAAARKYREAWTTFEKLYPVDAFPAGHPDQIPLLLNMGTLHSERGDFHLARDCYSRAEAICRNQYPAKSFPQGHPLLAKCLTNHAVSLAALGENTDASKRLDQALEMYRATRLETGSPTPSRDAALCFLQRGRLARRVGNVELAEKCFQASLDMQKSIFTSKRFPKGHPELAQSEENMGLLLAEVGKSTSAKSHLQKSLQTLRKMCGANQYAHGHPALARALNNLATVLGKLGEDQEAILLLQESLAIHQRLYPKSILPHGHWDTAVILTNLGRAQLRVAKASQAVDSLRNAYQIYHDLLTSMTPSISESEAMNLAKTIPRVADDLIVASRLGGISADKLYETIWNSRGLRMQALLWRRRQLRENETPEIHQLQQELLEVRRDLGFLSWGLYGHLSNLPNAESELEKRRERLEELQREKERLERRLAKLLPETQSEKAKELPLASLVSNLPDKTALVDYRLMRSPTSNKPLLVAFVVSPNQPVHLVSLGAAENIDKAVKIWREILPAKSCLADLVRKTEPGKTVKMSKDHEVTWEEAQSLIKELREKDKIAATLLRKLVWADVEAKLPKGAATIYLIPDGSLHFLPFHGLPGRVPGRYLLEDYTLIHTPNGPWLAGKLSAPCVHSRDESNLLCVGGLVYDEPAESYSVEYTRSKKKWTAAMADRKLYVRPDAKHFMPGTEAEARYAAHCGQEYPTLLCVGRRGGIHEIAQALPKARWAHFTTHGGYDVRSEQDSRDLAMVDSQVIYQPDERTRARARSPLSGACLTLSGADVQVGHQDAGEWNLTAEHIAGMELEKLELVVLSACKTAPWETPSLKKAFMLFHAPSTRREQEM